MKFKTSLAPHRRILLLFLMACAAAHAQSENELIDALATSDDAAELRSTVESIRQRLSDGSGSPEFREEIVRVVTTSLPLRRSGYVDILLQAVGQDRPYSEQSLVYMAEAISAEPQFASYRALQTALRESAGDLPDAVFDVLVDGLNGPHSVLNVGVLSAVPLTDPRYDRVINGIVGFLRTENKYAGTRSFIRTVGDMHDDRDMPTRLVDALFDKAVSDSRLDVRVEALDALAPHQIDAGRANLLAETLHRNVMTPDAPENDGLEYSPHSLREKRQRVALALLQVLDSPYPAYFVDMWVAALGSTQHRRALEVIQDTIDAQGLSDQQFRALVRWLNASSLGPQMLEEMLDLNFAPLPSEDLVAARTAFGGDGASGERVVAGYRLHYHYRTTGVPVQVADMALQNLGGIADTALTPVSLVLVRHAAQDAERYTTALIELVGGYADNREVYSRYLRALGARNAPSLVLRYAGNDSLPGRFRYAVLRMLDPLMVDGAAVDAEIVSLLDTIARQESDNLLVQTAGQKLEEFGAEVPARVALRNPDNLRAAIGINFIAMLLVNGITFFVGLFAMLWPVPADAHGRRPGVAGSVVVWLLLTVAMAIALIIGFVGFIGHNSPPAVSWTFGANLPAMLGTALYVSVAVAAVYRTRKHLRLAGATR